MPLDASGPVPRYQPLAIDLHEVPCLVIGGGKVGSYKAMLLARTAHG